MNFCLTQISSKISFWSQGLDLYATPSQQAKLNIEKTTRRTQLCISESLLPQSSEINPSIRVPVFKDDGKKPGVTELVEIASSFPHDTNQMKKDN